MLGGSWVTEVLVGHPLGIPRGPWGDLWALGVNKNVNPTSRRATFSEGESNKIQKRKSDLLEGNVW